jgi:hypothetical protein
MALLPSASVSGPKLGGCYLRAAFRVGGCVPCSAAASLSFFGGCPPCAAAVLGCNVKATNATRNSPHAVLLIVMLISSSSGLEDLTAVADPRSSCYRKNISIFPAYATKQLGFHFR